MQVAILDQATIRRALTFERVIPAVRAAMVDLSAGRMRQTLRQIVPIEDKGMFGVMQGTLAPGSPFGAKVLSVFPGNVANGGQSHQGLVILFDPGSGAPTCIAHAGELTAIRTAAASAVATDALANPDASRLAVLGTGEQARRHVEAISTVRTLEDVRVWGRSLERAEQVADDLRRQLRLHVTAAASVRDAVAGADIVCTTTAAVQPVLHSIDVPNGAHLNVVGSSHAGPVEIDEDLVVRARFFADHRQSVLSQGAEFLRAKATGRITDDHVLGEIGEVLSGRLTGRRLPTDLTIYKSLGNIVQDLASAALVLELAALSGALCTVDL